MRQRGGSRQGGALVALCVGLAALPAGARAALRDRLLDLHVRVATLVPDLATPTARLTPAEEAAQNRGHVLEAELARLRRALLEAGAARELVAGFGPGAGAARMIPADALPLGRGVDAVHRLALARGRLDGVEEGQPVLAGDALVGLVARATPTTCEARLVTDPTFRVRGAVARAGGDLEGLVSGDGGPLLTFVPALLDPAAPPPELHVGEVVLCSRASSLCGVPAVLGVVEAVERTPGTGAARGRVRPTVDLTRLGGVVIIRPDPDAATPARPALGLDASDRPAATLDPRRPS